MNQIKEWLANQERAERTKPVGVDLGEAVSGFVTGDGGIILKENNQSWINLSYDQGATLREWLNRIYGNAA